MQHICYSDTILETVNRPPALILHRIEAPTSTFRTKDWRRKRQPHCLIDPPRPSKRYHRTDLRPSQYRRREPEALDGFAKRRR
ncbi:hypothetical protein CC78DRAFT_534525 [Lojkania enalia]|uniref:Uncharacterized protein n=1 Tax=Lojkania enalia TaxID=147567 RepID=A0A9P4N2N9_9PLEO|nr:hypothetical protein CC78DRAFT_534525 [Didymosphaeria enalia]